MIEEKPGMIAFNYEDFSECAQQMVEHARAEARRLLEEAAEKISEEKKAAAQRGYNDGYSAGCKKALDEFQQKLYSAVAEKVSGIEQMLGTVRETLENVRGEWVSAWERNGLRLACLIAKKIIRRELRDNPEITLGWVREMFSLATGETQLLLRLHPSDRVYLETAVQRMAHELRGLSEVEIMEDETLMPGECVLDSRYGKIDQRVDSQLVRIEQELM